MLQTLSFDATACVSFFVVRLLSSDRRSGDYRQNPIGQLQVGLIVCSLSLMRPALSGRAGSFCEIGCEKGGVLSSGQIQTGSLLVIDYLSDHVLFASVFCIQEAVASCRSKKTLLLMYDAGML